MRIFFGTSLGLLLAAPLLFLSVERDSRPDETPPEATPPDGADVCATGCSATPHLDTGLSAAELERLLKDFARQPMSGESEALETLLFHGSGVLTGLDGHGSLLDARREAFLRQELRRTHARLDVRIVDEHGIERLRLGETRVPLGEKQHLHPRETNSLQPPEVSGTVRRVGLKHLWARL